MSLLINTFLEEPWRFTQKFDSPDLDRVKDQLKCLYDQLKTVESNLQSGGKVTSTCSTLPELITKQLDDEQIWQQLELQNSAKLNKIRRKANDILDRFDKIDKIFSRKSQKDKKAQKSTDVELEDDDLGEEDDDPEKFFGVENDEDDENERDDEDSGEGSPKADKFFDEKEMEEFLEKQEKLEAGLGNDEDKEEEDSDLEDEGSDEDIEGLKNYKYKDFFERANNENHGQKRKVRFENEGLEDDEMEEDEEDVNEPSTVDDENIDEKNTEPKSTFEIRQAKLKENIEKLEQRNLGDKPWQQTGEVWAKNRPENSLLEEYVEFEHTTRLAPVITQETTQTLEDLVKQRIKDKAWDDVERKVKPINEPHTFKNNLILDQEKSKLSLSQVYEQEYLKQTQEQKEEVKDEQHEEVRRLMRELFVKLDALTNYRYTPKLPQNEIKIVNNTKSIVVEEVAPLTLNDADMLAPEEVKKKSKFLPKSADERTKTDKLRDLRRKKQMTKEKVKRREEKEKKAKVPKDKLKMLQKLGKIHKVEKTKRKGQDAGDKSAKRAKVF